MSFAFAQQPSINYNLVCGGYSHTQTSSLLTYSSQNDVRNDRMVNLTSIPGLSAWLDNFLKWGLGIISNQPSAIAVVALIY